MRLNKYIARAGIASRRRADELTANGNVKINGSVMKEPGYDVMPGDMVEVNGKAVTAAEKKVYILLNKPEGYITTAKDEKGRATVMDLVRDIPERIFPVGRLDNDTSGLLIMTNDGDMANALLHPSHEVGKVYRVTAEGVLSPGKIAKLQRGVDIGGFVTSRAKVELIRQKGKIAEAEIEIHEGKNRQVRKMFAAAGCRVLKLKRISMGDVRLGRLKEGQYRKLTEKEIRYLRQE